MGISIGNEVNTQNAVLNNLYSSVKGMTSQFLNVGTQEFANYLNKNFDSIDKNADKSISKEEIKKVEIRNQEIQKLLDNKNLEKMMARLDSNKDEKLSFSETQTVAQNNVPDILKSSLREIQSTKDFGVTAVNFAQNLYKNYSTSPVITNAVSAFV